MLPKFLTAPAAPPTEVPWEQPAPVRGMDGTLPITNMPLDAAVYLYNLIPSEYGCQLREGYRLWAQNISGGGEVRSIIPFSGTVGDFQTSKIFVATNQGIYDVSARGTDNPTAVVTFATTTGDAGYCSYNHLTTGENQMIQVADAENGLYEYNSVSSLWTKYTTEITGADPNKIAFTMSHKGRVWFIERDSAHAWYLPVGAITGAATKFEFGSKMRHGGYLVGLYNWSIDGGDGLDDYLIAVSRNGDVLAYRGSDPAQASTWDLVGSWFIGTVPEGRRIAFPVGGDTLFLSSYGLISVTALLQGVDPSRIERNVTGKISRIIRNAVKAKLTLPGWEVRLLPERGLVVINTPKRENEKHIQFVLNLNRVSEDFGGGWGMWRDVPALCFESYFGAAFLGAIDGKVYQMFGSRDGVSFSDDDGLPIEFSLLGPYNNLGAPGVYKQVQFIRPQFIAPSHPSLGTKAFYDFFVQEIQIPKQPGLETPPRKGSLWDVDKWDSAIWSGQADTPGSGLAARVSGGDGYGRSVAIAVQGSAVTQATLANIEGTYTPWKFL